ncbi:receptor-like protein 7 [Jatropha curcas]|uniref:receptor-like protein 7 n=1 Tax=Jatropha curcas TaxID=180498 RepID=UPI001892D81B|nr:receptor-like protein 7 [Jatropha curcas]
MTSNNLNGPTNSPSDNFQASLKPRVLEILSTLAHWSNVDLTVLILSSMRKLTGEIPSAVSWLELEEESVGEVARRVEELQPAVLGWFSLEEQRNDESICSPNAANRDRSSIVFALANRTTEERMRERKRPKLHRLIAGSNLELFGNLSKLIVLELGDNNFTGQIPSSIGKLDKLYELDLSYNNFSGPIPPDICRLSSLVYLMLSNNLLTGQVDLTGLILSSNEKLTGEIPFAFCELKSLQILDLSSNNFSGPIPQCLGNFSNSLSVLHLGMNNFNGVLPQRDNTFPSFLQTLQKLQILQLRSNRLHGLVKRHSIANYLFPKLRILDLSNNNFSGPLPSYYFNNFDAMINVDQHMTYMRAPNDAYDYSVRLTWRLTWKGLEIELVKIQTLLTTINLSGNNFTGKIPKSVGKLKGLKQLNMSHNHLTGNIEPSIGNLTNLESLDLSSNNLTGRIPIQLATLTSLAVFSISHNQLEGPIPTGPQFNTFDNSSYEGNTRLCGFPLQKACNSGERQQVMTPSGQEDSNSDENGFGWKSVFTGYAFGAVFGLAMGYLVFRTRKPTWLVKLIEGEGHPRLKRSINNTCSSYQRRRRRRN